jgi:hypothetical protein
MVISVPMNLLRAASRVTTPMGAGLMGIVWVVTLTAMARGLWAAAWFRRGNWAHRTL